MTRVLGILVLLCAALGMVGCGEKPQVVMYEQGKYQGKPDTPSWGDGDRTSWESRLKQRQLTQNEYGRMY